MIKTLAGREISVSVGADSSVLNVKESLSQMSEVESPPVDRQKLIHQGKVLADTQLIRDLELSNGGYVVLMVTKPQQIASRPPPPLPEATMPPAPASASAAPVPALPPAGGVDPLQGLRDHPHFPQIRRLVQEDPGRIPELIQQLGQMSPFLLDAIERNMEQFMAMLYEPVARGAGGAGSGHGDDDDGAFMYDHDHDEHWGDDDDYGDDDEDDDDMAADDDDIQGNMQLLQMLAQLSPEERVQFANAMGLSQERFEELQAMFASLPPDELQDLVQGDPSARVDIDPADFSEEERASIERITALGFTQVEAVNAFVACDRNEGLAANFLLDGGQYDDDDDEQD